MSSKASSTIGFERRFNPSLAHNDVADFIAESAAAAGTPRPPNMERIVELNRGPFVGSPAPLEALSSPGDATVLDVRSAEEFARGHVHGAINIPVEGSFATKAGFVLAGDEHVALYAGSESEAGRAARGLHAVGLFNVDGYLAGADASEPWSR